MIVDCSGPRFESLKNPFTGLTVRTKMSIATNGRIRFFAPDEYSPAKFFPSAREAYRQYNRVEGVEGLRAGQHIVCPYTGRPLSLEHTDDGYRYVGGFNPGLLVTREEWLYQASMRNGVSAYPKPEGSEARVAPVSRRAEITEAARKHADEMKTELSDEALERAENTLRTLKTRGFDIGASETVSMSSAPPKGKKGSRK